MVQFKFKLSWELFQSEKTSSWTVKPLSVNGGQTFQIGTVNYNMTGNNTAENWEQGEGIFHYDFNSSGPYSVSFPGGNWIFIAYGSGGNWNIETIIDLHVRNDTNKPNTSPLTTSRAMYRVKLGCPIKIKIPITDPDGDVVKCRWSTASEAASISNSLPNAVLDEFLIRTENMTGRCNEKSEFRSPTPSEGSLITIEASETMAINFYVYSSVGLKAIDVSGPPNIGISNLYADDQGRQNIWYVTATWTPKATDQGTNIICATAEDNNGKISDTRCFVVSAWDVNPCESEPCKNNGTCQRIGLTNDFTCQTRSLIDYCANISCLHNGVCTSHFGGFTCDCLQPWSGKMCEHKNSDNTSPSEATSTKIIIGVVGALCGLICMVCCCTCLWFLLRKRKRSKKTIPDINNIGINSTFVEPNLIVVQPCINAQ